MGSTFSRLIGVAGKSFGIQLIGFLVANYFKTEKFYDLTGSLTYLYLVYGSWARVGKVSISRRNINSALTMLWATRLGSFLFARVLRDGRDRRFDKVKYMPR